MRYLDSRIALLIQNVRVPLSNVCWPRSTRGEARYGGDPGLTWQIPQRMALDEQEEVREHLEETQDGGGIYIDDRKQQVRRRVCLAPVWQSIN